MKKLLMTSAAVCGLVAFGAADAQAQIEVSVGGHTKNYIGWLDQDTVAGADERSFDMLRESELHFNAVGVADNGLEYGFQVETEVDDADDAATIEESYLFLSGDWGRVNLGSEDGSAYLLQIAAPSADSNIDGIRQYINPVNYTGGVATTSATTALANVGIASNTGADFFDYDNDETGKSQKITYLSPIMNGFQVGVSYTPDVGDSEANGLTGFNNETSPAGQNFEEAYEGAVRYEGTFNNVGLAVGAGYTHVENTGTAVTQDDLKEWNVGLDLDIGAFGIGAVYTEENRGLNSNGDADTIVVGIDYTTGPFKLGASYYNQDTEVSATTDVETDRYTGGVIYTAAEGLTFRGSVSHIEHEFTANPDFDATSVMGGIQFNF